MKGKMGMLSLQRAYRKLIRILDDWYRKGIQITDYEQLKVSGQRVKSEKKIERNRYLYIKIIHKK